jgi:ATP-dependent Clp protease protease subunit
MARFLPRRVFAKERPGALPMPATRDVSALTKADVLEKWGDEAAGIRAVAGGRQRHHDVRHDRRGFLDRRRHHREERLRPAARDRRPPVEVQINSPGGDMFEGIAIYNVLREHPQEITVKVMGMAASAASIIAMAGDKSRSARPASS